jgi:glycosyltransferase involved in cell wall biosynthesis
MGLYYQMPLMMLARLLGCRVLLHHHSFAYVEARSIAMSLITFATNASPQFEHIVLCDEMESRLSERYRIPADQLRVISNSTLFPVMSTRPKRPEERNGPVVLGHLSNLCGEKGIGAVVDSFEACLGADLNVELQLAGPCLDGRTRAIVDGVVSRHPSAVRYHGAIEPEQVATFMQGLDIFVFPSRYRNEAQPLVLLEALAAGATVVATPVGCIPSMLGPNGVIAAIDDFGTAVVNLARSQTTSPIARQQAQVPAADDSINIVLDLFGSGVSAPGQCRPPDCPR